MKGLLFVLPVCATCSAFAQKCVNPHFDAQRLDFRDLGYPGATALVEDLGVAVPHNSIYAMTLSPDRKTVY